MTTTVATPTAGRRTGAHAEPGRTGDVMRRACTVAATASGVAGVLHAAAAATNVEAGDLVVGFFGATALAQSAGAVALMVSALGTGLTTVAGRRRTALLAAAGAVATAALICLYVVVHGTDLLSGVLERPGQQTHGSTGSGHQVQSGGAASLSSAAEAPGEPVSALGTTTVAVELLALAAFVAALPPRGRRMASNGLLLLAGLAWVLWLSGVLG